MSSSLVFSLDGMATSNGECSGTNSYVLSNLEAIGCSSLLSPCLETYSGNYSSKTIVPQLDDPYYSSAFPPNSLPVWNFSAATSTDRIPPDTTMYQGCKVCGDAVSGNHFGVPSCDACKSFFRRSLRTKCRYSCRANRSCNVNLRTRGRCQYCRLVKCLAVGMKKQAIQNECISTRFDEFQSPSLPTPVGSPYNPSSNPFYALPQECQFDLNFGSAYDTNYSQSVCTSDSSISRYPSSLSGSSSSEPSYSRQSSSSSGQLSLGSSPSHSPHSAQETPLWSPDIFLDDSDVWLRATSEYLIDKCVLAQDLVKELEACLTMMIQWSMKIPEFRNLGEEEQVCLLRNSWCEQCALQFAVWNASKSSTLGVRDGWSIAPDQIEDTAVHQIMRGVVEVTYWLEHLNVDRMEIACMRGIMLFNPVSAGLTPASRKKMEVCQEHIISLMTSHASRTHGDVLSQQRAAKLLFQLAPLKCISQNVIVTLRAQRAQGTLVIGDIFDELVDF